MTKRTIKRNRAVCFICDTIIESKHVHDFVTCKCGNVSVDGGRDYIRRAFEDSSKFADMSEFEDETTIGQS